MNYNQNEILGLKSLHCPTHKKQGMLPGLLLSSSNDLFSTNIGYEGKEPHGAVLSYKLSNSSKTDSIGIVIFG